MYQFSLMCPTIEHLTLGAPCGTAINFTLRRNYTHRNLHRHLRRDLPLASVRHWNYGLSLTV
jgi:hypothetical protein